MAPWTAFFLGLLVALAGSLIWRSLQRKSDRRRRMGEVLQTRPAKSARETVREILTQSLSTGMEILLLIDLLEAQNSGGVNNNLHKSGLGNPAIALRNSLMTRLIMLVAREYSKPQETDRNLHRAYDLLKNDATVRETLIKDRDALSKADEQFRILKGDHRYQKIRHFRDKFTAHIGEPEDVPLPLYKELFAFARATVDCIDQIASATGIAVVKISENNDAKEQAEAFWAPWRTPAAH